jgi:hypothetical protein
MDKELQNLLGLIKKNIRTCIHMNYSPKKLQNELNKVIEDEINMGEHKKILYNACFGGFSYSKEFANFIKEKHNKLLSNQFYGDRLEYTDSSDESDDSIIDDMNRENIYPYIVEFAKFLNITETEALLKASGRYSELKVQNVPAHKEYTINEYDGCENVKILDTFSY